MVKRLYIEGGSIAEKNMSGVGHTTLSLIRELAADRTFQEEYKIIILVPFNKKKLVESYDLPNHIVVRGVYLPGRVMNGLVRFNLIPYMDVFFGKGIYLFPNFKNWPLLFSKSVTYIHDVYFKVNPSHIESKNLDMLQRHTNTFIKRTDTVATVSEHAKKEIEKFFPVSRGKVQVVYNGVNHELYYPRPRSEQIEISQRYNLTVGKYFVFFSNIEPRKNIDTLLDAYKLLIDEAQDKDVWLLLVGGMGWGNEATIKKIEELKTSGYKVVKPSWYVPDADMPALLTGSIGLVHPALYEGFGLTPLEAMACGRPVIVGNNSSLPEVMGSNYQEYVDITSAQDIKEAMRRLIEKPIVIDEYGIKRAQDFSWSSSAATLKRIINETYKSGGKK